MQDTFANRSLRIHFYYKPAIEIGKSENLIPITFKCSSILSFVHILYLILFVNYKSFIRKMKIIQLVYLTKLHTNALMNEYSRVLIRQYESKIIFRNKLNIVFLMLSSIILISTIIINTNLAQCILIYLKSAQFNLKWPCFTIFHTQTFYLFHHLYVISNNQMSCFKTSLQS